MVGDKRHPKMQSNVNLASYLVTKNAWKGSYKRVLSVGTQGITTYRKDNLRVTNQWLYQEIFAIRADSVGSKAGSVNNQQKFNLVAGGPGGRKDMSFSSEYRTDILTDMLRFRSLFAEEPQPNVKLSAVRVTWSEKEKPVFLEITPISIDQIDQVTGTRVACYAYRDIQYLAQVTGLQGAFAIVCGSQERIHLFRCSDPVSLMNAAAEAAALYLGFILNRSLAPLTVDWCREMRLGPMATPENMISTAEFVLQKVAPYRHGSGAPPLSRTLCLTDCLLVERDPISYRPISAQPLCEVFALIRSRREPQMLSIEYINGKVHTYYSSDRDSLLCSILDGVRASGNQCVCVRSTKSRRSLRLQPTSVLSSAEVESMHLRFLRQPPEDISFWEVIERFNANVAYSGLVHAVSQDGIFTENKERLIKDALIVLLSRCPSTQRSVPTDDDFIYRKGLPDREVRLQLDEARFQAIRRLVASKAGFEAFTQLSGVRENLGRAVVAALAQNDDSLTHAVIDAVNTLMQPMHESPDLRQEQLNKASIMSSAPFMRQLVNLFTLHALRGTGSLVISGLLDFFTFALCLPYSETSEGASFETLLTMVASRGRAIFRLFSHPSLAIVKGAGLVMRAIIDEASEALVAQLRQMSLAEGALLQHILIACFANVNDPRNLVLRQLSRQLIALWTENNPQAQDLLKRVFPEGLLSFLDSPDLPPETEKDHLFVRDNLQLAQEHVLRVQSKKSEPLYILQERVDSILQHWRVKVGLQPRKPSTPNIEDRPVALRLTRRMRIKLGTPDTRVDGKPTELPRTLNWPLFYYHFQRDHAKPDLIWNLRTRDELKDAIEKEVGEYCRECSFFSHSRLENEDGEGASGADYSEMETLEEAEAADVALEAHESGEDDSDSTVTSDGNVGSSSKSTSSTIPTSSLERQVSRLLTHVNEVSWNHAEFRVRYHSLAAEPRVGNYFLRLLLEEDKRLASASDDADHGASTLGLSRIKNSREFFSELFRRYLQYTAALGSMNSSLGGGGGGRIPRGKRGRGRRGNHLLSMRCLCLNAMTIVYGRCYAEIGAVSDIPLLVHLMDRTPSAAERDCLITLLEKLVIDKYNADEFLEADGVRVVTDLACLSHLHTARAPVPTATNVLKGDADNPEAVEGGGATQREWWYWRTTEPRTSEGPFTFTEIRQKLSDGNLASNTYVFAQGLDSQPRCRIEGVFVGTEEDEKEAFGSNSTSDFAPFGATTTGTTVTTKTPLASTLGWMPANRVTQLRWSVPRLLFGEDAEGGGDMNELGAEGRTEEDDLTTKLGVSQGALLDHTALAIRCVEVLKRLCERSASRDETTGGIIRPLPRPRRAISSPFNLPHIVQLLLTFDPPLVERVASLLLHVVDQNPCLPRIYLTGVFFFILMYTGSNVLPIVRFLKATHLLQAEETSETGLPSVLSKILPEAMIAFLDNHPPEKFAEIFLGDFDTPEAIWNQEMRRFMISRIAAHLADFTPRLKSNVRSIYHHIGIPRIIYAQLEGELFCNRYYLRHFCDTSRFPDWPVKDPIALLRDILAFWRVETEKKPSRITYEDSLRELGLEAGQLNESNQESSIRRAYYQLSMKYHPDKNPNGQAKFQAVKAAYNFLCERGLHSDGPNRRHIQLLIRAQSILYSRYRKELAPHKYAGYPALIRTIRMEVEDEALFQKGLDTASNGNNATELLSSSTELAYETVTTSALNAEELRREGGLKTLQDAFERCSALLSLDNNLNNSLATNVCCHVTGFFTVSTKFSASRECICEIPQIVREIIRLLYYKNLLRLCCQAAACAAAFCEEFWLCTSVYQNGGVFMLLYHILAYDFTLEESGVEASSATNKQITLNQLSLLCLWALARLLNGIASNESQCEVDSLSASVEFTLNRLLTPYITRKLFDLAQTAKPPAPVANVDILLASSFLSPKSESGRTLRQLAKLLTTNSATPCFIWDNQCRAQMSEFLDEQVLHLVKTGEADLNAVKTFEHKTLQGELLVGEIFVRIFNKQPAFPLDNPKGFVIDLLNYLKTELALLPRVSDGFPATTKRVSHLESALEALRNVVHSYAGVELQCIGHFDILFGILELEGYADLKLRSIEVLHAVAKNPECLNDIHASNLLVVAVILFRALPLAHLPLLDFFAHVVAVNSLLKELVYAGGLIYLLEAIATSEVPEVRRGSAELLSRCLANPQLGRRIQALLGQFLPAIFPETIRGAPQQFVALYDSDHLNPELIWNQDCRDHLTEAIIDMCNRFNRQQEKNHALKWSLPDAYAVSYATAVTAALRAHNLADSNKDSAGAEASLSDSLEVVCVGGVYLQIYVSQAAGRWMLRQPETFLEALMTRLLETFNRKSPETDPGLLRLLSRAALQLLADRPGLLDGLPKKGFAHRILDLCPAVNEPEEARTCALLIHAMSASKLCVGAMMERETIAGYRHVISYCVGEELGTMGETLFNIFNTTGCDPLVAQALKCDLIDFLLQILQRGLPVTVREPGQCRAYIVKALKAMQKNPLYGAQVSAKLDAESDRWLEFRDQSHALFLTNAPQSAALASTYLTAGASGSSMHAGFLTGGISAGATGTGAAASTGGTAAVAASNATVVSPALGPGGVPIAPPQPRP